MVRRFAKGPARPRRPLLGTAAESPAPRKPRCGGQGPPAFACAGRRGRGPGKAGVQVRAWWRRSGPHSPGCRRAPGGRLALRRAGARTGRGGAGALDGDIASEAGAVAWSLAIVRRFLKGPARPRRRLSRSGRESGALEVMNSYYAYYHYWR